MIGVLKSLAYFFQFNSTQGLFALILALSGFSCSQRPGESQTGFTSPDALLSLSDGQGAGTRNNLPRNTMVIEDLNGQRIANAEILIGQRLHQPFAGNLLVTDARGQATIPRDWREAQPVTIRASGFVVATYFEQRPQSQLFKLRLAAPSQLLELRGQTQGFQVRDNDGQVDFGLVFPAVSPPELFSFDLTTLVSPLMDRISVLGQSVELPSNLTLPRQRESYIFPLTLDKPQYRTYFDQPGAKQMVALRGQFPIRQVFDAFRAGTPFVDIINLFSLQGAQITPVQISQSTQTQNLSVVGLQFDNSMEIRSGSLNRGEVLLVAPLSQVTGGGLWPTDIKKLEGNGQATVRARTAQTPVAFALKNKDEIQGDRTDKRVSVALIPFRGGMAPEMLPIMAKPRVSAAHQVRLPELTSLPATHQLIGAFLSLSAVTQVRTPQGERVDRQTAIWEVYLPQVSRSGGDVILPELPNFDFPRGKKEWGVSYLAQQTRRAEEPSHCASDDSSSDASNGSNSGANESCSRVGAMFLDQAQFVTYSSVEFN